LIISHIEKSDAFLRTFAENDIQNK